MRLLALILFVSLGLTAGAAVDDLAPTGTLRAVFIARNPVQAVTDSTGEVRGPAADLTRELAQRLGVPFKIAGVANPQAVIDSVASGAADIGFVAFDPARAAQVDFSQAYALAQNTYLVLEASPLRAVADLDRPGIRIGVNERDAGDFYLTRTLKHAELRRNAGASGEVMLKMLTEREIDAYAGNRQRLSEIAARLAGVRLLPDNFYGVEQSIIVAKGKAGRAVIDRMIDEARASGFIAAAIARAGLTGVDVAPPKAR